MIRAARVLRLIGWLALAGSVAAAPDFRQVGFSTLNALGDNGTTGGGDVPPIVVRNAIELQSAVERSDIKDKEMRQRTPRVVLIAGDIDLGELKNTRGGETLTDIGTVRVASYTTIAAEGSGGATIDHGIFDIHGAHNVIV
ncbi:MAG TPA: hypothetical protein VLI90_00280, partial [Tepidisphaeraceae bacterium]|nr:hypothetical protein [Tepidisphaeraceae bacterium]